MGFSKRIVVAGLCALTTMSCGVSGSACDAGACEVHDPFDAGLPDSGVARADAGVTRPDAGVTRPDAGLAFVVRDSLFVVDRETGSPGTIALLLTDSPGLCAALQAKRTPPSTTVLAMVLSKVDVSGNLMTLLPATTGTYAVVASGPFSDGGLYATGAFNKFDSNCNNQLTIHASTATSGQITVPSFMELDGGVLLGTYSLHLPAFSEPLTGALAAPYCNLPWLPTNSECR